MVAVAMFLFFTALVGVVTWLVTRKQDTSTNAGFFLAGRSLTFPLIAISILLTNLSTEQMVGLNGDAFLSGFCVMAWEVVAVIALVAMALFFLPRFLKSGIATIPQLLEIRFDHATQVICNVIFLAAYACILMPIILYTGARGLADSLDVNALTGIESDTAILWIMVWSVGIIGACYTLFGGLKSIAVSNLLYGIGLLIGGFMIVYFGLKEVGGGEGVMAGVDTLRREIPERLNSIGGPDSKAPFVQLFTGILIINMFYFCTNQQIIQNTLGAKSLEEGQKGVLLCGLLKLLGPLYLVLPGIIAYYLFVVKGGQDLHSTKAYGTLVRTVMPTILTGFFAAAMFGAILSSFNGALNSTCTLFSLGIYKNIFRPNAPDKEVVLSGRVLGVFLTLVSMCVAPLLANQTSIFSYLQKMNAIYFIPIFAVVLIGLLNGSAPAGAAKFGLVGGVLLIVFGYFVCPSLVTLCGGEYHFVAIVFVFLLVAMWLWGVVAPRPERWVQQDVKAVELKPWKGAPYAGAALLILVVAIYWALADFSVLRKDCSAADAIAIEETVSADVSDAAQPGASSTDSKAAPAIAPATGE